MDKIVKMIIGDKVVDMPARDTAFNRLTTTGEFVLQTADGDDLVASCVSFVASSSDNEPTKQFMKLNNEWKELPVDSESALVVFFRNITVVELGDDQDYSVEAIALGQSIPYLVPVNHWQLFHMQPGVKLSVRSRSNSRILLLVMPR